jgi:RNA polymerase subunit RPABC4/transcription elongation factor Spt4
VEDEIMVAYCLDCKRYVNQYCEVCSGNFGISQCERFGCGGRMLCPNCGGNNLSSKREEVGSPYDFARQKKDYQSRKAASDIEAKYFAQQKEKPLSQQAPGQRHCPLCGYKLEPVWKFCPECGVSLIQK